MFYIVFGDFPNNPLSSGFNSVWQKTPSVSIFGFSEATGLEKRQDHGPHFEIFETNKIVFLLPLL
jgi:hypothetical protein